MDQLQRKRSVYMAALGQGLPGTTRAIAMAAGVDWATANNVITGRRPVHRESVEAVAAVLGMTPTALASLLRGGTP